MKGIRSLTLDVKKVEGKFKPSTTAERRFYAALKKVARASGHIVEAHVDGTTIKYPAQMQRALEDYSKLITPWAARQSKRLLEQVAKTNKRNYQKASRAIGAELRLHVAEADVGAVATQLMVEQVGLIKSIPIEAGLRAQQLALESITSTGARASEIAKELQRTTGVTESRARLIAVTETARANASFTQSRAVAVGAQGYYWRATMDEATRPSHRKMNGKKIYYSEIPTLDDGTHGHAGTFPNCRCYQEPFFED